MKPSSWKILDLEVTDLHFDLHMIVQKPEKVKICLTWRSVIADQKFQPFMIYGKIFGH